MDLLKVGDRVLHSDELVPLLSKTNLLSRLIQEIIIEDAIAEVELTPEEVQAAQNEFCQRNKITNPEDANAWAKQQYGTSDLIQVTATREKKLEKFKHQTFGKELESYFLQRKGKLDRVIYSLIRTSQLGLAQELYFRIHDDGQPFADLAKEYSEGQEAKTGGLIGPVELSVPHPALAGLLSVSKPGQIWPPKRVGEWYIVVRLERFVPAQLDEPTKQRLLDEMFQTWMREQLQQSPVTIPNTDTVTVAAREVTQSSVAATPLNREASPQSQPPPASPSGTAIAPAPSASSPMQSVFQANASAQDPQADPWG